MRISLRGVRGSIPVADPGCNRYGGNTSCVAVELEDGPLVVLDAGTGIRPLGAELAGTGARVHVLLTHLHLDHIHGPALLRAPARPRRRGDRLGPALHDAGLRTRLARYLSTPLSPVEIRELPAKVRYRECPEGGWEIGSATVRADAVAHRGPTSATGWRRTASRSPTSPTTSPRSASGWIATRRSGSPGTRWPTGPRCSSTTASTPRPSTPTTVGWGHSKVPDALSFARRAEAERVLLFHHDPGHEDDVLDALAEEAAARWGALGAPGELALAREGQTIKV